MIPVPDLVSLLDALVGDTLRTQPGDLGYWLHEGHSVHVSSHTLDPQQVATLARIASGEAYGVSQ